MTNEVKLTGKELDQRIRESNENEQLIWYKTMDLDRLNEKIKWLTVDCRCLISDYDDIILKYGSNNGYVSASIDLNEFLSKIFELLGFFDDNSKTVIFSVESNHDYFNKKYLYSLKKCLNSFEIFADAVKCLSSQVYDSSSLFENKNVYHSLSSVIEKVYEHIICILKYYRNV